MSQKVRDILRQVRDIYVSDFLEELSYAIDDGFDVEADAPADTREGILKLPFRYDIVLQKGLKRDFRRVAPTAMASFAPATLTDIRGCIVSIEPFSWDAALVKFEIAKDIIAGWGPLRQWALEAMQPHIGEETPDLRLAIHRVDGPDGRGVHWSVHVDLGTAPVSAVLRLCQALADCGAQTIQITDGSG